MALSAAWSLSRNTKALFYRPTGSNRAGPLDGLRALAAIWVVVFHVWGSLLYTFTGLSEDDVQRYNVMASSVFMRVVGNGELGVDIFFILSGLLIMSILSRDMEPAVARMRERTALAQALADDGDTPQSTEEAPLLIGINVPSTLTSSPTIGRVVRDFFVRRTLRIAPVYIFSVLVGIALEAWRTQGQATTCKYYFWRNFLFIQNFFPSADMCLIWSWSVAVEVQMYLVSPFIVWASLRWPRYACAQLITLTIVSLGLFMGLNAYVIVGEATYFGPVPVNSMFFTRLFSYTLGMLVAHQIEARKRMIKGSSSVSESVNTEQRPDLSLVEIALRTISIILVLVVAFLSMRGNLPYPANMAETLLTKPVFVTAMAYIMYDALVPRPSGSDKYQQIVNAILSAAPLYFIAQISYSIYMLHLFLVGIFPTILQGSITSGALTFNPQWIFPVSSVFLLVITSIASVALYYVIEKPAINIGNDYLRQHRQ